MYSENGVNVNASTLYEGKKAKIKYSGFLSGNGAEEIYIHLGFGLLWESLSEIKMKKKNGIFEADVPLVKADTLNFCFRDNNNNWDNNSFQNYSYEVKKMITENKESSKAIKGSGATVSMIDCLDLTPNNNNYKSIDNTVYSKGISYSLVPVLNSEFGQFRRLPESYLRNKKMRILFYRMFAYVPRLLNGHTKRRAKSLFKK